MGNNLNVGKKGANFNRIAWFFQVKIDYLMLGLAAFLLQ
jgi:hypothetical protein